MRGLVRRDKEAERRGRPARASILDGTLDGAMWPHKE